MDIASKDVTRTSIQYVLIERVGLESELITLTATNGHIMVNQTALDPKIASILDDRGILIHIDDIKKLKALKIKRINNFSNDNTLWVINDFRITIVKNTGIYPAYRQIIPNFSGKTTQKLCFNAEYLEMLQATLLETKSGYIELEWDSNQTMGPIRVKTDLFSQSFGVLMPCKPLK